VVTGGARRQDSVAEGFAAVSAGASVILVHDAARPFVSGDVIDRAIDGALAGGAVVPAVPVHDTVKQVVPGDTRVVGTLPRETLFLAQTPQAFRRDVLAAAIDAGRRGASGTDEAMLAEQAGHDVRLVAGDDANVKITTAADLERARAISLVDRAPAPAFRIGTGYDLHVFAAGRPLVLGGVRIPYDRGLRGHSDADAVCHAVTDAILGAANLGDIGRLFPDTDPRYQDADSLVLLADAAGRVQAAGWLVVNVDVVVIAERPKIGPHAAAMQASLAATLGVEPGAIAIKGKTNEGVDATGRGEALAVHAVALIARTPS
jgi:2-C-methyl-D-erythritol 4-phosphate cytidylyltransferase/2-C-methyl-D-erythritol 2,4-cyclodiphosphate synthase